MGKGGASAVRLYAGNNTLLDMYKFTKKRKYKKYIEIIQKTKVRFITYLQYVNGKVKRQSVILKLKKGDIILAKPSLLSLSPIALLYRVLLNSEYVHSMLYIGNSKIIHTTVRDAVTVHKIPRKIYKRNRYTIYRVRSLNSNQRQRIVEQSLKFKNMKTDIWGLVLNIPRNLFGIKRAFLKIEKNRLWCSKLIYQAYYSIGIKLVAESESSIITSESLSKSKYLDIVN